MWVPSQTPPHAVASVAHGVLDPRGTPLTGAQVPTLPATLHASHCPLHAALQHTPSLAIPDVHSDAVAATCALKRVHVPGCEPLHVPLGAQVDWVQHTPSVQVKPALHWAVDAHDAPAPARATHAPALQKKPLAQSVFAAQLALHAAPTQLKTPHAFAVVYPQSPAPLHPAASYSTPLVQIDVPVHALVESG